MFIIHWWYIKQDRSLFSVILILPEINSPWPITIKVWIIQCDIACITPFKVIELFIVQVILCSYATIIYHWSHLIRCTCRYVCTRQLPFIVRHIKLNITINTVVKYMRPIVLFFKLQFVITDQWWIVQISWILSR